MPQFGIHVGDVNVDGACRLGDSTINLIHEQPGFQLIASLVSLPVQSVKNCKLHITEPHSFLAAYHNVGTPIYPPPKITRHI